MADSDFNVIRPVEGLQSIQGLTPTRRRQERRHQQQPKGEQRDEPEEKHDQSAEPQAPAGNNGPHAVDYCA